MISLVSIFHGDDILQNLRKVQHIFSHSYLIIDAVFQVSLRDKSKTMKLMPRIFLQKHEITRSKRLPWKIQLGQCETGIHLPVCILSTSRMLHRELIHPVRQGPSNYQNKNCIEIILYTHNQIFETPDSWQSQQLSSRYCHLIFVNAGIYYVAITQKNNKWKFKFKRWTNKTIIYLCKRVRLQTPWLKTGE